MPVVKTPEVKRKKIVDREAESASRTKNGADGAKAPKEESSPTSTSSTSNGNDGPLKPLPGKWFRHVSL